MKKLYNEVKIDIYSSVVSSLMSRIVNVINLQPNQLYLDMSLISTF